MWRGFRELPGGAVGSCQEERLGVARRSCWELPGGAVESCQEELLGVARRSGWGEGCLQGRISLGAEWWWRNHPAAHGRGLALSQGQARGHVVECESDRRHAGSGDCAPIASVSKMRIYVTYRYR